MKKSVSVIKFHLPSANDFFLSYTNTKYILLYCKRLSLGEKDEMETIPALDYLLLDYTIVFWNSEKDFSSIDVECRIKQIHSQSILKLSKGIFANFSKI